MSDSRRISHMPLSQEHWHELRAQDVTSTESAALFDMSPYLTKYELYYRKAGRVAVEAQENWRMMWGQRLQDSVARCLAEDNGVKIRKLNQYMRLPGVRMGSSFDFEIIGLDGEWYHRAALATPLQVMYQLHGVGNFEIKCVDWLVFRDQWTVNEDKSIEAPAHIEIQVQHQMHVSGRLWAAIGLLVSGNTPKIIIREYDEKVGMAIDARIRELYADIEAGRKPQPVFPADADLVCKLNGYAEPGKVYDGREDMELILLCQKYRDAQDRLKLAEEEKQTAKAKVLQKIGESERALVPGFSVSASLVGPAEYTVKREGYRNLRITPKRAKEKVA